MKDKIISDISEFIFVSDSLQKSDAIFLPGGSHPQQPELAAQLYLSGLAEYILPSGGISIKRDNWPGVREKAHIYNGCYNSDCEFFSDVLIKNGVPKSVIVGEDKSRHTRDNAFFTKIAADEAGLHIKKAIIVCKAFHARRCLMLYSMAFPETEIRVFPVYCYNITKDNWFKTEIGIKRVLGELARCGNQFESDIMSFCNKYTDK